MELSQEPTAAPEDVSQPADHSLRDQIEELLLERSDAGTGRDDGLAPGALADEIIVLLTETGHVIPGAPPAAQILSDARSFAERLVLSNLAARIINMLAWSSIKTPESDQARKWIEDYLEGKKHGPIGKPMLWPGRLPGLASMLRDWGFVPTIAQIGQPSYVARAAKLPTVQ